jgi:hypothetical protein
MYIPKWLVSGITLSNEDTLLCITDYPDMLESPGQLELR